MPLFYMLFTMDGSDAGTWPEGSVAGLVYPVPARAASGSATS